MVQVEGVSYRVVTGHHRLELVRLLDDRCVGAIRFEPQLRLVDCSIQDEALRRVAREALRRGIVDSKARAAASIRPTRRSRGLSGLMRSLLSSTRARVVALSLAAVVCVGRAAYADVGPPSCTQAGDTCDEAPP